MQDSILPVIYNSKAMIIFTHYCLPLVVPFLATVSFFGMYFLGGDLSLEW